MARFSSIIYECVLTLAAVAVAGAQATHPAFPVKRGENTQANPQAAVQQAAPQMNRQGSPAPNAAQQMSQQQQVARPADPPPTTQPSPPVVTYRDGLLTVQALNSTLNSVVAAIRSKTGIEFENWESVPDRVAISQGPAPSGEVLAAIFAGSRFDFVAIGRPDSPEIVQRIIFSPKKGPGNATVAQRPPQNTGQDGDDDDTPDEQVNANDPQDTAVQPPVAPQAQQQPPQQNQQPKTPDQLLQELQEMQKLQQQQQQQQGDQNPSQVPRKPPPL
jgi:hypothetical protein